MPVPMTPLHLMHSMYKRVFPIVHEQLCYWKAKAKEIPNEELRRQALSSITHKTFHCEGGAVLALLSGKNFTEAIRFIVAYQTISDYLDNLCDRSTSLDPADFAALHEAMEDALSPGAPLRHYYRYRLDQNDGGYLVELVKTCQSVLAEMMGYEIISPFLKELCRYYCDLQIHKHVKKEEREERLIKWFKENQRDWPQMEWYEFSACAGSTLAIFCLVAYSLDEPLTSKEAQQIKESYFPYIQGLHILLDYFIDQQEDQEGGDLNFCFYYQNEEQLFQRFIYFIEQADERVNGIKHAKFHRLVNRGLLGMYLSDSKANEYKGIQEISKKIIRRGGAASRFFYLNGRTYRRMQQWFPHWFGKHRVH
ncbi:tetraprenyl-beta-curcumene synthase [Bacillus sp. FJAT-27231]|uniref:tetraprenyl-beta-curcumene synthase family protein n=1 Tax=Bacillus sp. FJAT-27231 TaxID=1679168 RepID=UPI000670A60E|nr:tetraprenyl-beta-curcumene synthase family protein [Bacillus sp. FJAT-27231]KMY55118.1 tetraprenyl-beta-curcumene synthase [Bacillus sp. FJAT-27231]